MSDANNTLPANFGDKIRELRNRKNLSQEQLASKAQLDRTYISGIERGLRNPSLKNIAKIAKALDVEIKTLFPGAEDE